MEFIFLSNFFSKSSRALGDGEDDQNTLLITEKEMIHLFCENNLRLFRSTVVPLIDCIESTYINGGETNESDNNEHDHSSDEGNSFVQESSTRTEVHSGSRQTLSTLPEQCQQQAEKIVNAIQYYHHESNTFDSFVEMVWLNK